MTLHWWMHWFWVTTLLIALACSGTLAAPQSEEMQHMTTDIEVDQRRQSERQIRAMYYSKTVTPAPTNITETTTEELQTTVPTISNNSVTTPSVNESEGAPPTPIQWTPVNVTDVETTTVQNDTNLNVTVRPYINVTETQNATFTATKKNVTRPDFVKDDTNVDVSENRIVTEKPLSLETAYQTRFPPNIESSRRVIDLDDGGMDTGAIAGISFAALVLAALVGSTAFVLYRRRYLNKPQTLNDKCSNPDSSGYLDDSTIRDNSEEMYSLDNDSFLNSLEAMTIQNYWTDTVKHTKL